jgi:anti-anti-sigma factor
MSFDTQKQDNYTAIVFSTDKLDAIVAPDLKAELVLVNKEGAKNIILDMSSVKYCDSSGLSALLIGNRLCAEVEGSFILCNIGPSVEKLITISQLNNVLTITDSIAAATDTLFVDEIERNLGTENLDD